jgi:hypothetical protein
MDTQEARQLAREKALYRYSSALERGDFEAVVAVLAEAEQDSELEQMILEMNEVYRGEWEMQPSAAQKARPKGQRAKGGRWPRFNFATAALIVVLVFVFGVAGLTLLGPAVGNVFSSTTANLDSGYVPDGEGAALPTAVAMMPTVPPVIGVPPGASPTAMGLPGTPLPAATAAHQAGGGGGGGGGPTPAPVQPQERMIIKNGEMRLLVEDTDIAIDQVTQIAADNGGYVLSSQAWSVGWGKSASMTIAVEAENFDLVMRRLRDISLEVLHESASGQDVSAEYVDLQSRLRNLESTRDRLRAFLEEAQTVQEALAVNQELANIEAQIEQVVGRMTYLSGRAAFSTINISLEMPAPTPTPTLTPTPTPTPAPWSLGPKFQQATETQVRTFHSLTEALTWIVIVPGPYLVVLGLIGYGVWRLTRRREK